MIDISVLNLPQQKAVTANDNFVLVIAGAGSGKTRTLTHRLAWLIEQGVPAEEILLLTFTRKASREMLLRAQTLIGSDLTGVTGGTFHGFAYSVLRHKNPEWATGRTTIIDTADASSAIKHCRDDLGLGKGISSFPKGATIQSFISKARNKEISLSSVIEHDAKHLYEFIDDMESISKAYTEYKHDHNLLDYDDLLFELESLLANPTDPLISPFRHILVDEYQDTNKIQARIVRLLSQNVLIGGLSDTPASVMAVGDDAQSIYAFRGADVRNILDFPKNFPGTTIIKLEENYRSSRPILEVANSVLADAREGYAKNLFTSKNGGLPVKIIRTFNNHRQAAVVARCIEQLLGSYNPTEIAVLFRSGRHSFQLEGELKRFHIPFVKFGGIKASESKHVKDVLAFARLLINPLDQPSFIRIASLCSGIGPKTAQKIYIAIQSGDQGLISKAVSKYTEMRSSIEFLDTLQSIKPTPHEILKQIIEYYKPILEHECPDDHPSRYKDLEEMLRLTEDTENLEEFLAQYTLDPTDDKQDVDQCVILSTIHSAKGLEWDAVLIIDLAEDRFPSRHAIADPEEFEEERRLMYVACTRAKKELYLCVPRAIAGDNGGSVPVAQSPYLSNLPISGCEEWTETYGGQLIRRTAGDVCKLSADILNNIRKNSTPRYNPTQPDASCIPEADILPDSSREYRASDKDTPLVSPLSANESGCGFCRHKIFGRGKIVQVIPPNKYRVYFQGFGLKVILKDYLIPEENS